MSREESEGSIEFRAVQQKQGSEDKPAFVDHDRTSIGEGLFTTQSVGFEMTIELDVLLQMAKHSVSNTKTELGGVLVGFRWPNPDSLVDRGIWIGGAIPAEEYHATRGSFTFTHESWAKIAANQQSRFPQFEVLGWYHTHPGWGIFLSSYDQFICNHFFPAWYHVAIVIDPINSLWGVFDRNRSPSPQERDHFYLRSARRTNEQRDSLSQSCLIPKSNLFQLAPLLENDAQHERSYTAGKNSLGPDDTRGPL